MNTAAILKPPNPDHFYYARLPIFALAGRGLTAAQGAVYAELHRGTSGGKHTTPGGRKSLGRRAGVSEATAQRALRVLHDLGLIQIFRSPGGRLGGRHGRRGVANVVKLIRVTREKMKKSSCWAVFSQVTKCITSAAPIIKNIKRDRPRAEYKAAQTPPDAGGGDLEASMAKAIESWRIRREK